MNTKKHRFEVAVIARMRHGILHQTLKRFRLTYAQAANLLGISHGRFGEIVRLKRIPSFKGERGATLKQKFEELTGRRVEELFPNQVLTPEFLEKPKTIEVLAELPERLLTAQTEILQLPAAPDVALMEKEENVNSEEFSKVLNAVLSTLTEREEKVIRLRFFDGRTRKEIGQMFKVTSERAKQIEVNALRKLRHPALIRRLQDFASES